jgi:hypothetical protein
MERTVSQRAAAAERRPVERPELPALTGKLGRSPDILRTVTDEMARLVEDGFVVLDGVVGPSASSTHCGSSTR